MINVELRVAVYGTGDSPLGLGAGYTRRTGGLHLQAAVSEAVLWNDARQELTVKAPGVYDLLDSHVERVLGRGIHVDGTATPSFSFRLVESTSRVIL